VGYDVSPHSAATPADHLLRWYPQAWRDRYGEEFAALLLAEIEEQPRSWRRTADVAMSGVVARLSFSGLASGPLTQARAAIATTACILAAFAGFGTSLWSQLVATSRIQSSHRPLAGVGLAVLTVTLACLAVLATAGGASLIGPIGRALRGSGRVRVLPPLLAGIGSSAALVTGGIHLAAHWPVRGHSGVPASLASFAWAETFSINAYWAHPGTLSLMHPARLAWMLASPIALIVLLASATVLLRRVELSMRVLRFHTRLLSAALLAMVPMLGAAAAWVLASQHATDAAVQTGTLDLVLVAGMGAALAAVVRTTRRIVVT
jgi:hypothetical protein